MLDSPSLDGSFVFSADSSRSAEFKYGGIPDETFAKYGFDQAKPNRLFYHLKKDVFPRAYFDLMMKGQWYGRTGLFAPAVPKA